MKCIYCLESDRVTFRGVEHVIPQAFGTFGANTPTLDCVCDDCNKYFGQKLDCCCRGRRSRVFLVTRVASYPVRLTRSKKVGDLLSPMIQDNGPYAGLKVFIDGQTGRLYATRAQFHAFNFQTNKNEVYFLEDISGLTLPDDIYGLPRKRWRSRDMENEGVRGHEGGIRVSHRCTPGKRHRVSCESAIRTPCRYSRRRRRGLPTALVAVEGEVVDAACAALAKILMNFVTWALAAEEALQPRWDFLRKYVRYGEGEIKWRMSPRPFWDGQETDTPSFVDDSIDIRIENLGRNIVGSIRFYARETYQLILGENEVSLPTHAQVGCRFTPGIEPIPKTKMPEAALNAVAISIRCLDHKNRIRCL